MIFLVTKWTYIVGDVVVNYCFILGQSLNGQLMLLSLGEVKYIVGCLALPNECVLEKKGGTSTHLGTFVSLAVCGIGG